MNDNYITVCECDSCGDHVACVLYHCNGTPVFGECNRCNPANFEAYARYDIARYLAGEYSYAAARFEQAEYFRDHDAANWMLDQDREETAALDAIGAFHEVACILANVAA